ncbi:MAG: NYN domain-containing protein [Betaproteobacteria bacterium]|nr:NYN domain-containing protein [Betaproteobacteria bacterium]
MHRVIVYVDGFNLYFGLRSKQWQRYYWLDLVKLGAALVKPGQTLTSVQYFTSRIRTNGRNTADVQRQTTYLEALATLPLLHIHYGHYLEKPRQCRACGAQWMDYEEKMTDVNLAVQMFSDAMSNQFDTALLISADSDLTTPVKRLRGLFPNKRVISVFPPNRRSFDLEKASNAAFTLGEAKLRQSQLPATVSRADGYLLHRPAHWM